ncbi:MAG: lactonase family protein [Ginsengibacter sp.]
MKLRMLIAFLLSSFFSFSQNFYLVAGTYTGSGSKGIYIYHFSAQTGKATWISNTDSATSPSFLVASKNGNFIYAVNETGGTNPGRVSAYSFNRSNGSIKFLNSQLTGGDDPCHLALSKNGKWLAVANYTGGNLSIFPLETDGSLKPYTQLMQDSGTSINKERQEKAHVHGTAFSTDGAYLFTPDLGLDKVMIYKFNALSPQPLSHASPSYAKVTPGNGPRHITFHPGGKFAYVINELSGSVTVFNYNNGKLKQIQDIITHPKEYKGQPGSAEIFTSPDGKFLYASNRGDESNITVFSINSNTGKLALKGYQSTLGKEPRSFVIDPTGNYLLAGNQESDNISIFKINKQTGLLQETQEKVKIPKPVSLQMIPAGK